MTTKDKQQETPKVFPPPAEQDVNDPLLELAAPPKPEGASEEKKQDWKLPRASIRTVMLLQKIDSVFVRDPIPLMDEKTGEPRRNEKGEPLFIQQNPTVTEAVEGFFVMLNEDRPDLLDIIKDQRLFDNMVLDLGSRMDLGTIQKLSGEVIKTMMELNQSAKEASEVGGPEKNAIGPTGP